MSLLKVSLCINTIVHGRTQGCRSKRSPIPWKNKNIFFRYMGGLFCYFFSMWEPLCYVFLFMRGLFHRLEAFSLLFLYTGAFLLRLSPDVGHFSQCGGSNYDSLIVRTVAFPVQVAYWIQKS